MRRRAAVLLAALAPVLAACGDQGDDPSTRITSDTLTIYTSLPLRGEKAALGRAVLRGEKLALDEAGGRVGDLDIGLIALDDTRTQTGVWDARQVAANARIAAENPTTIAYIGDLDSGASAVSVPIVNEIGVLQVSPLSTYTGLTKPAGKGEPEKYYPSGRRTFARLVPTGAAEARALAALVREGGAQRAVVVQDGRQEGLGSDTVLRRELEAAGLLIETVGIRAGEDVQGLARELAADAAGATIYAGAESAAASELLSAVAAQAPAERLYATSGVIGRALAGSTGLRARLQMISPLLPLGARPPAARAFATRYEERFGAIPPPAALYGYEAMRGVLDAIARAGEDGTDRRRVIEAYFGTKAARSVLGPYSFDADGDIVGASLGAFTAAGGALRFDGSID